MHLNDRPADHGLLNPRVAMSIRQQRQDMRSQRQRVMPSSRRSQRHRFRPTRARRWALALMVQRLVQASQRVGLQALGDVRGMHILALRDWPDVVRVHVGLQSLVLEVVHEGEFWDALLWPDVMPQRQHGRWRCADPTCTVVGAHECLEDLLWAHLARPLLDFLNQQPDEVELHLCSPKGRDSSWAELVPPSQVVPEGVRVAARYRFWI